jgi:amino acid adenylation domain-containing protein
MSCAEPTVESRPGRPARMDAIVAQRLRAGARRQQSQGIARRGTADPAPLSFAQQRLWFIEQVQPGTALYNVPSAIRLTGPLELRILERAFTEVVRRHEALRTTFAMSDSTPVQEVRPPKPFRITVVDLQNRPAGELDQELAWRLSAEASHPFDLCNDLMLRATVFRLAPRDHVLLITMHHIASDAWSIAVLFNELAVLYNAFRKGMRSPLPELPIQYGDFAVWQRYAVAGPLLEKQLAYWREKLADAPPSIDLQTDRSIAASPSYHGGTRSILLPTSLALDMQKASQQSGITPFMYLLTAFKILLHRYSGQADLVVGSPVAGRSRVETEPLIGFFLNTLVLRSTLSGSTTVSDVLTKVRDVCLEAFAHQELPFEKLVQELQPDRHASRTPLFQMMFTLQSAPMPVAGFEGLVSKPVDVRLDVSPFDLTLFTEETAQGLNTEIEYRKDLFDAPTIDRMLTSLRVLLEAMIAHPQKRLSDLPLLSPAEQRLLRDWNATEVELPADRCIHELIFDQAARNPDAVAVSFGQRVLTYRTLNEQAEQLAQRLRDLGVGPGILVGVCLERSPEMIVGLLGVLKAGGAFVPLDPAEPHERLAFKLQDSRVSVVLTQHRLLSALPPSIRRQAPTAGPVVICLDDESDQRFPAEVEHSRPAPCSRPDDAAYVIYTSGSTGTPKAVLVEQHALVNHSLAFAKRFGLRPGERALQFAPLNFDVSAEEIFPALISGATLVLRPELLSMSIADFTSFLARENVTLVNLPTPYWSEWLNEMAHSGATVPSSLRTVIVGSQAVPVEQFRLWRRLIGNRVRWCNAYGITEATITSTIYEPSRGDEIGSTVPIGKPCANTAAYILDPAGQPVPVGVRGELYIGGAQPARGYLNQPELTNQKFLPDPFSSTPNARMVRTGDLARWQADGNIEFLGRVDDQVKIRGFRVELAEIEALLLEHELVRDAAVLARDHQGGEKRLVAYVVPGAAEPHLSAKLREYLKTKLPGYMIPSAIVELQAMPLLPSGKVDRKTLPAPAPPDRREGFAPATGALEQQLVSIWAEVLHLDKVGIHDNFFDLGGHSLLAVKLGRQIEKLTGRNLPLVQLFQFPTIAQLAKILRRDSDKPSVLLPINAQMHGGRPPLFLVHGAGGGMLWGYANLARYLPENQPVYAFNSRGMNGLEEFPTVEEIARSYVEELLGFQSQGPFYLGGYCFGGEVAFEMARQLSAQKHRVALLALFNAMPPNSSFDRLPLNPLALARFAVNAVRWLNHFRQWTPEQRQQFLQRKLNLVRKALQSNRGRTLDDIHAEDWIDVSEYPEYQRRLWDIHLRASARYIPRRFDGHITLFRTRIHPVLCSFDPAFDWGEFAGDGCTVKVMKGAHESLLDEPYVRLLAKELDDCLVAAQAPAAVP